MGFLKILVPIGVKIMADLKNLVSNHLFLRNPEYVTNPTAKVLKKRRINGKNLTFPEYGKQNSTSARVTSTVRVKPVPQRTPQGAPVVSPAGWKGVARSHAEAKNDQSGNYIYHGGSVTKGGSFDDQPYKGQHLHQPAASGDPTGWIQKRPRVTPAKHINMFDVIERDYEISHRIPGRYWQPETSSHKNPNHKLPVAYGPR